MRRPVAPGARIIPDRLRVFALPLTIPYDVLAKRMFAARTIDNWQAWYGMAYHPLREMAGNLPHTIFCKPQHARSWKAIGDPVLLTEIDFKTVHQTMIEHTRAGIAKVAGELNGVLIYFELGLRPDTVLSTHAAKANRENDWRSLVWAMGQTVSLQPGDRFVVTYRYRVPGTQDLLQVAKS